MAIGAFIATALAVVIIRYLYCKRRNKLAMSFDKAPPLEWAPCSRDEMLRRLESESFDLLVVGGGCTGVGCALDAATRGLKVALIERMDFGSGTSSKSTKLVHGGVRYLAKAVASFGWSQYKLVFQALSERTVMFSISPYLTNTIKIIVPIYSKAWVPYYYIGLKLYDWMSGIRSLGKSYFIGKEQTVHMFPQVNRQSLHGAMVYFDGQQDDARNNVMLAVTAAYHGAVVVNHMSATELIFECEKIVGIRCRDEVAGKTVEVRAKGIINSTGNLVDTLRMMDEKCKDRIVVQSSGTHIVLSGKYTPRDTGFLDPQSSDGRVIFFMPWMGKTLVGSTDARTVDGDTTPTEEDLDFLLNEVGSYSSVSPRPTRRDVSAVWTGIRPLVKDCNVSDTNSIVRKHYIGIDDNGLITITGGKWTIYRKMAEEAIDIAVNVFSLHPQRQCVTRHVKILGAHGYTEDTWKEIKRKLKVPEDMARRFARFYGTRALKLARYMADGEKRHVMSRKYSYLASEVEYCIDNELAASICDVLSNRLMISLFDVREAYECVGQVLDVFRRKHRWGADRCNREEIEAVRILNTYGLSLLRENDDCEDTATHIECPLNRAKRTE
ncbi:FAD-dependent oxidoreductase [Ordospora pajunii]|uniref:FAD-dependent oxidoreductase n=1 Tax=Ordospora pajunii TaxID=3039483 RepID=UPI0029526B38|nr:FAD-dependent oxidoreductase [Ordospora pajunii]KAH9411410.1 FAD-dependent oxidoreductase [Ordospora pajunii]